MTFGGHNASVACMAIALHVLGLDEPASFPAFRLEMDLRRGDTLDRWTARKVDRPIVCVACH